MRAFDPVVGAGRCPGLACIVLPVRFMDRLTILARLWIDSALKAEMGF